MAVSLLAVATVIVACVIFNKISSKLGIPALLAFILLGMFFGTDGVVKIEFDNYSFAYKICTVALLFIMFYGGFGTKWSEAKPIAAKSIVLSSLGTVITACLVGMFCHYALKIPLAEGLLIGSVVGSTDAASVFSILRSKHLNLKYNTASLLEVESGSNDPFSFVLTILMLSVMNNQASLAKTVQLVFCELLFGALFGVVTAFVVLEFLKRYTFVSEGFDAVFMVAVAIVSFALPTYFGGNGYLSVYITGIILGNKNIGNKLSLVHFFDGMTGFMQMLLFFLLGLLATPSRLPAVAFTGLMIALFLTFVARPLTVFLTMTPFRSKFNQQALVAWSGMRGAASIVFAILAVVDPAKMQNDIYHIVFFIVLFSILVQGSLIPFFAKKLDMIDDNVDVMKTFTDYSDEVSVEFIQFKINKEHPWNGKLVKDIILPPESLLVLLLRESQKIVPNGKTELKDGDELILSGRTSQKIDGIHLYEKTIEPNDPFAGKMISEVPAAQKLVIMIRRGKDVIIPKGKTVLRVNDVLVINDARMTNSLAE